MVLKKNSNIKMLQQTKISKNMIITTGLIFTQISHSHLEVAIMDRVILMIINRNRNNNNRMNSDMIMDSILLRTTITIIILSRETMAYDEEYDMSSSKGRLGYGLISLNSDYVLVLFS